MFSIHAFVPEVETEGRLGNDIALDGALVKPSKLKIACEPRQVPIPTYPAYPQHFFTRLRRLLNRASAYRRVRMYHRDFAEDWADEYGRLIVMGEAAYPIWVSSCVCSGLMYADPVSSRSAYKVAAFQSRMLACSLRCLLTSNPRNK